MKADRGDGFDFYPIDCIDESMKAAKRPRVRVAGAKIIIIAVSLSDLARTPLYFLTSAVAWYRIQPQ
jgi:hypothetical protein